MSGMRRALTWGAIAAQLLSTASWFVGGLAEGRGYRASAHDISDLGAPTADHPWIKLAAQGVAGVAGAGAGDERAAHRRAGAQQEAVED
ncbi:hypothetical protein [Kitasatospora sp. GP82]|uniref:hypothetical protein n=1 Tax=Kitasatospora sp. GP82 TaxID=3035089 RepID=UPI0024734C68|nr:hypothetical protein [Kitasatospora sp. GP82]MDH6124590.1 hypothetical protein [Kitasatospora sp. GP82]